MWTERYLQVLGCGHVQPGDVLDPLVDLLHHRMFMGSEPGAEEDRGHVSLHCTRIHTFTPKSRAGRGDSNTKKQQQVHAGWMQEDAGGCRRDAGGCRRMQGGRRGVQGDAGKFRLPAVVLLGHLLPLADAVGGRLQHTGDGVGDGGSAQL